MKEDVDADLYADQAHKLVDFVIESALKKLQEKLEDREKTLGFISREVSSETASVHEPPQREEFDVENIEWLSIEEFSVEKAEQKIHEFIETWSYEDSWQYCIDYLGVEEFEFDTRHRYRIRWSIPTRRKPIPRATASVYFTFEVSTIQPKSYPVNVYYVFETNRLVHRPGFSRFREKWLKDIIESKVLLISKVNF